MKTYQPELGQAFFGQQWQSFECPGSVLNVLKSIRDVMDEMKPWHKYGSPFSNSGARYKNDVFECNAYDWNEDNEQPYNFKWRDIEVSWYKYLGRGTTINRKVSGTELNEMLNDCIKSLK